MSKDKLDLIFERFEVKSNDSVELKEAIIELIDEAHLGDLNSSWFNSPKEEKQVNDEGLNVSGGASSGTTMKSITKR